MIAMRNVRENAEAIWATLTLTYNKVRQTHHQRGIEIATAAKAIAGV